jgi:hypothetical protein
MKTKTLLFTSIFLCLLIGNLFLISAVSIKDVLSSPQEVTPGEIIDISIEVENIFEEDVYNLNIKLDLFDNDKTPLAPYQSSSEKFLDELEEGDEEKFKFELIVLPSAHSGIYKIPVEITYEDIEGNLSIKNELISITINPKPELKISLTDSVLIRGKENTFSIKLINSGLADVKFVYLTVNDINGIKFLSEKEQYIGNIDSDDSDSLEYFVYINKDSSKIINLPVILQFKDTTNKEFIETKNIVLKTYSLKEAQDLGLVKKPNYTISIIIGILILSYFIYRIRKRRKSK